MTIELPSTTVSASRSERILDTTRDLLLRWGHDRVTVGEIARRTAVGKGTVYLHWATKDDLFRDAVARECELAVRQAVQALEPRRDVVRLSEVARLMFQLGLCQPLYRALNLRDAEVLGRMALPGAHDLDELRLSVLLSAPDLLDCFESTGPSHPLGAAEDRHLLVAAVVEGFLAPQPRCRRPGHQIPTARRAHQLERVLRQAFEPLAGPALSQEALARARRYFGQVIGQCAPRAGTACAL